MSAPHDPARVASTIFGASVVAPSAFAALAVAGDSSSLLANGHAARAAAAGDGCRVILGPQGCAALAWHDGARFRFATATTAPEGDLSPGEQRIRPDRWYRVNGQGEFIEVPA
jgi:hypothetical protein